MRRWIMGMTVIDPLVDSGMGALGDWRCGVLGRASGNIYNEFRVRKKNLSSDHSLDLFLA